jgi:hypothetical protein
MPILKNAKQLVRYIADSYKRPTEEEVLRRKWAGRTGTDVECLAARMGRLPRPAEVQLRMGSNSRQLMNKLGIKPPQTARSGLLLSEIDQTCKRCPEWRLCMRWLASGKSPEAYRRFCPNIARWDEFTHN